MRRKQVATASLLLALIAALAGRLDAQAVARDKYLRFVPLSYPKLYEQSGPSRAFALYGDPASPEYRDASPVDGMDDRRALVLKALAAKFAPIMVQNTVQMPMDFKRLMRVQKNTVLHVDTWDLSFAGGHLVRSDALDLLQAGSGSADDEALLDLLDEFHPEHPRNESFTKAKRPGANDLFKVLFFDQKGEGPASWKAEYEDGFTRRLKAEFQDLAKAYAHPFIVEAAEGTGETAGYEFVLQYWFFYPINDGGNNHESDWESLSVVISPRDKVDGALAASDIEGILAGKGLDGSGAAGEELVIKRVEYCLHHKLFVMDYSRPNVYLPRAEWEVQAGRTIEDRWGSRWLWETVRNRAYEDRAETRINTHPLAFIGGDGKGFDQILSPPGGTNRDSHGTYPFPGTFRGIGPMGASEGIHTSLDLKRYLEVRGSPDNEFRERAFKRNGVVDLGDPARIEIVPDWERIVDLVRTDPEARREWAWLVLPLRFGYPATASPAAGIISHAETGNLSCVGPAFNPRWNRVGETPKYEIYAPHRFPGNTPLDIQDDFRNDLGFLNVAVPFLKLPPLDLAGRVLLAPFQSRTSKKYPVFMEQANLPFRFQGFSVGFESQALSDNFSYLVYFPTQLLEIYTRLLTVDPDYGSIETREDILVNRAKGLSFRYSVFVGRRLVTENSIFHSVSTVGQDLYLTNGNRPFAIRSDLDLWEYRGSLRFNLATGGFQPFVKAGYGLAWYRLKNIATDGEPLEDPRTPWITKFPWHYGGGVEFLALKTAKPGGIDLGIRVDYLWVKHTLGFPIQEYDLFNDIGIVNADLRAGRRSVNLTLSLSF